MAYISDTYTKQREAALDLLETIAPDADAQQAQEFVRAFIHMIGGDFLTMDPSEAHWQNRDEFLARAEASANHHGKLIFLAFPRTEIQGGLNGSTQH